jgi:uncharacterized repeat protein (TIGR01451 family)
MTSKLKLLGASAAMAVVVATSVPAMATTQSGTDVLNTVNVSFQVGGVTQVAPPAATNTFKVDRKVLFTISEKTPAGTTNVSANQTGAITSFTLSNTSNDILDFTVTPANILNGNAAPRGTDAFDLTGLLICQDNDNNGVCDAAAAASVTIDNLAKDTGTTTILIIGTIPGSATNGQIGGVTATATALNGDGTAITAATDATVNGALTVETVFADTGRNGIESADDDYTVAAAALTVLKTSRVVFDNINGAGTNADPTNPKSVPGATVEYCISIANASGAATASSLNISDIVPANTTFVAGSIKRDVTVPSALATRTCTVGTAVTDAVGYTAGTTTVASAVNNIAGGSTSGLIFRVTIN